MESTSFFEKKISLTPKDLNRVKKSSIEDIILEKAKASIESKCSEHGFVLPGSITLISRSMGYFEPARFTGDAVYYCKLQGKVIYPADGVRVIGKVIRKNKMGLYVNYRDAIRIQVPRDLHLGSEEYENVKIGDNVEVELKRSKFQINDAYILASGVFISNKLDAIEEEEEEEEVEQAPSGDATVAEGAGEGAEKQGEEKEQEEESEGEGEGEEEEEQEEESEDEGEEEEQADEEEEA
jgi:hypothetical protein